MKAIVKSGGFTLIETLIALFILSFALLALAGLMVTTTRNNSVGGHMTEAATLAQDKLEEFRATPLTSSRGTTGKRDLMPLSMLEIGMLPQARTAI